MKIILKSIVVLTLFSFIGQPVIAQKQIDAKSRMILDNMKKVVGSYDDFRSKKDVQFDYIYDNFDAGKDVSQEKFIIAGESTWAKYSVHQRNVLPGQEGMVEQSLINGKAQITLNGKFVTDEKAIGGTVFIREVNPFWFSMIYKLEDGSTIYQHLGTEEVDGKTYDKISLKYDNGMTGKAADDEYILYFNQKTHLIDFFYFSLPAMGVNDPIIKMEHNYEVIDGIYVPTVRRSYAPNPETGKYTLNGEYTFKNVKFNNGFKEADFVLSEK